MSIDPNINLPLLRLNNLSINEQIEYLEKLIKHHNKRYFIENNPEISDQEFDQLTEKLKSIKPDSPVLFEIVGEIGEVLHPTPMLSIDKKYTYTDIKKWLEDTNETNFIIEPKYDGMAARYQDGTLATRGNGIRGENISDRLPYLTVIGELPSDANKSAYGEVIIPLSYFNEKLKDTYKNPRNAVVGIIKSKNVKPAGIKALLEGGIHLVLHDQAVVTKASVSELLNETIWEDILEEMFHQDYPLDGIVIKVTSTNIKNRLGSTEHHEKWQVAYKSPAQRQWSIVKNIKDQVGRTGRITSVAIIDPINISGATVTNVTLHNYDYMKETRIGIGSKVEVMRSGEVIPFITSVIPADIPYIPRMTCPICNSKVINSGKYLECPNQNCPARNSQSIEYFFKVLGVEDIGLKTIEKLINELKLSNIIDFYNLKPEDISPLEGFGATIADKIVNNIQSTLKGTITESQLLQALGIKEIGPATSKWIINEYGFDNLPTLKGEDLENVKGIGPKKAEHFIFSIRQKWDIVEGLNKRGLFFKESKMSSAISGLKYAITGDKVNYTRNDLIKMIEENGGVYKTSITKDLDFLIAGPNAGSKLEKAQKLNIKVINEEKFVKSIIK